MPKKYIKIALAWLVTIFALYYAFRSIDWLDLVKNLQSADPLWILVAIALTVLSYLMRARRWQSLLLSPLLSFYNSYQVLILGFFMNNILPARTGELIRAHLGAKVCKLSRAQVLASIAAERLVDGLSISLMFVLFSFGVGDQEISKELGYVALFFAFVAFATLTTLIFREKLFNLIESILNLFNHKASIYIHEKFQVFVNGLAPLVSKKSFLRISLWSIIIWFVELSVYYSVNNAFTADLSVQACVLFLVAVNFSSLIPSAPGAIGVIEAVGSAVLVSIGVNREQALAMVISQHMIQYLVVGLPGAFVMLSWKGKYKEEN